MSSRDAKEDGVSLELELKQNLVSYLINIISTWLYLPFFACYFPTLRFDFCPCLNTPCATLSECNSSPLVCNNAQIRAVSDFLCSLHCDMQLSRPDVRQDLLQNGKPMC
ncbi:hypothetical protein BT67DRAFT_294384 [Trichocladium antarcticum]|uniref:Uncharacterized protein n=1 Tax=Trichocladium antarcticum TaxID=1450529 RepID=A0AAN6UK04_9PEZI|nr:hypothetical protein BT67DRAFT_294384 [Trichocladium antarcticum]